MYCAYVDSAIWLKKLKIGNKKSNFRVCMDLVRLFMKAWLMDRLTADKMKNHSLLVWSETQTALMIVMLSKMFWTVRYMIIEQLFYVLLALLEPKIYFWQLWMRVMQRWVWIWVDKQFWLEKRSEQIWVENFFCK